MSRRLALLLILAGAAVANAQTPTADLQITATADRPRVKTGEPFTLTLTARNNGPAASTKVSISLSWGSAIPLSTTSPAGWICPLTGTLCSASTFPADTAVTFVVQVIAPSNADIAFGSVSISGSGDSLTQNNRYPLPLVVDPSPINADLSIRLEPRQNPASPGQDVVVDAVIANEGPDTAPGAYLWATTMTGTSVSGPASACEARSNGTLCHAGAIAPHQTLTLELTTPAGAAEQSRQIGGFVATDRATDPNPRNNSSSASISIGVASDYEFVLVPLTLRRASGALRTSWTTILTALAEENFTIYPRQSNCVIPEGCYAVELPIGRLWNPVGDILYVPSPNGSLIYTHRGDAQKLHFTLRVRDESHPSDDWGAQIPVARERDFTTAALTIVDIPISSDFRVTLRVYDPDSRITPEAIIRYIDESGKLVGEFRHRFQSAALFEVTSALLPLIPAYLQVDVASEVAPLVADGTRISMQIIPGTAGQRLWGFASVTSNATQRVTILAPN